MRFGAPGPPPAGEGVPPLTAVTYMLAAPVINPVVLLSTYVAFGGNMKMVLARALVVACSAALTGWLCVGRIFCTGFQCRFKPAGLACADLSHPHPHGGQRISAGGRNRRMGVLDLLSSGAAEFLDMGKYLVLGALASAAFKVFLPWQLVQALGRQCLPVDCRADALGGSALRLFRGGCLCRRLLCVRAPGRSDWPSWPWAPWWISS
ncbi:MAG: permease [Desulfobacterales bacterium]|nr:permease [Desulfobacterales bacterium]